MSFESFTISYKVPVESVDNTADVSELLKLCRLCMNLNTEMHDIFQASDDKKVFSSNPTTSDKIAFCTGIQVSENDGLPQRICKLCFSSLLNSHEFKSICIQNDNILRRILLNRNSVVVNKTEYDFVKNEDDSEISLKEEHNNTTIIHEEIETSIVDHLDDTFDYDGDVQENLEIEFETQQHVPDKSIKQIFSKCKDLSIKKISANRRKEKQLKNIKTKTKITKKRLKKWPIDNDLIPTLSDSLFTCNFCKSKFPTEFELITHKKLHKALKIEYEGGLNEQQKAIIQQHLDVSVSDSNNKRLPRLKTMREPKKKKEPRQPKEPSKPPKIVCEICGKSYVRGPNHKQHLKTHLNPEFKCDICGHSTWSKGDLQRHLIKHTDVRSHPCLLCPKAFKTISCLRMHERRVHMAKTRDFDCEYCHKKYYFKENLKLHIATKHEVDERHTCDVCHEGFKERQTWRKHMLNKHHILIPQIKPVWRKKNILVDSI